MVSRAVAALAFLGALAISRPVWACGVSGGGSPGICTVEEHAADLRKWRIGAATTRTITRIQYSDHTERDNERNGVVVTLDRQLSNRWVLQVAGGALLYGTIRMPNVDRLMNPGAVFAASVAWRVLDMNGTGTPFLILTGTFAGFIGSTAKLHASDTTVPNGSYSAFDLRIGAVFGTVIPLGKVSLRPYGVARVFGGPIFWSEGDTSVTGTDSFKHQLGGGATLVWNRFDVFVEAIGIGERAMSAGLGVSF
jgi:hypothetical protein